MAEIKRATAYKLWITDLVNGKFIIPDSVEETPYLDVRNLKISRVNLIASSVLVYKSADNNYTSITIDDGSEAIRVKAWREDVKLLEKVKIGDLVNVIGRVRLFNSEIYVLPEIVKILDDPNWGKLRRLELIRLYGEPIKNKEVKKEVNTLIEVQTKKEISISKAVEEIDFTKPETDTITETERQRVLSIIENVGDVGIRTVDVALRTQLSEEQTENIIRELVKEGEIFHPKPGFVQYIG
ncbi:hypothetical protein HY498_05800 [Candidatus Woesearchaeota archaeon]|nr:hypothetical protein [Candidatus Woesearchaeota archaeon]